MQILVKNLHGTADNNPPAGFSSWIEYWESKTGRRSSHCSACRYNSEVGAHVIKVNSYDNRWFIVPLCKACNKREDSFYVPSEDLILANDN